MGETANHAMSAAEKFYTIDEVAQLLRVSARWLASECRAERVAHVHIARQRRFTAGQVEALITSKTIKPAVQQRLDATRERVLRQLARSKR